MPFVRHVSRCLVLLLLAGCSSKEVTVREDASTHEPYPPLTSPHALELLEFSRFVEAVHPEPFRFLSQAQFHEVVAQEVDLLEQAQNPTEHDIGRAYHRVIAPIRDFHMQVALPLYQPHQTQQLSLLPLHLIPVEGQVVVDASEQPWAPGTRLLSIEGVPIQELWDQAGALVSADGTHQSARDAILTQNFPKYFHLLGGMAPSYEVFIQQPGLEPEVATLGGISAEAFKPLTSNRLSWRAQRFGPPPPWPTLERPNPSVAVIRMQGFGIPDPKAYIARLDAILKDIGQVERLVLDVRQNQGGFRTYGIHLINHLVQAPYLQWRGIGAKVLSLPELWRERVRLMGVPEQHLSALFLEASEAPATREGDPLEDLMKPVPSALKEAEVIVLVDSLTNSAANEFVLGLKHARPQTRIVGEQVGGDCDRHVGEFPILYTAPTSGVVISVSLISVRHVLLPQCQSGQGLVPEVPITWSVEDLVQGRDPYLEWALDKEK